MVLTFRAILTAHLTNEVGRGAPGPVSRYPALLISTSTGQLRQPLTDLLPSKFLPGALTFIQRGLLSSIH